MKLFRRFLSIAVFWSKGKWKTTIRTMQSRQPREIHSPEGQGQVCSDLLKKAKLLKCLLKAKEAQRRQW